jgi:two-component system cell cycle sensor histidine kinase/response regulator CckA
MRTTHSEDQGAPPFSRSSLPSVVVDPKGRVRSMNPAAESLLGVPADKAVGRPLEKILRAGTGVKALIVIRGDEGDSWAPNESRARYLIENLGDGIAIVDPLEVFVFANPAAERIFGVGPGGLRGRNLKDFLDAEGLRTVLQETRKRKRGLKNTYEIRILPEGTPEHRILRVNPVPWTDEQGRFAGTFATFQDVSEDRRAEAALSLERSLLNALMENLPDHIYFKDLGSRFLRASKALWNDFKLKDASEIIGKSDVDFFSEEHARQAYEDELSIIRTGHPIVNMEERETWPDRPDTWVLTTKMPLRDQNGGIIGTFGISHDITERKCFEERILNLARFPDQNPYPVMRSAPDGTIIYSNEASGSLSSWARDGVMKVPEKYMDALRGAWERGESREIEVREEGMTFVVTFVPFISAGYVNLYGRNVTEEKSLAEKLTQSQKMEAIGRLAGGIAHDFNNILQVISGYCDVLKDKLTGDNPLRKDIVEIARAAQRAATLTAQLLAFSRKQILRPRVVNTRELVHSMEKMLERVIGEDVDLRTFLNPETGNIRADPGQLEQVLLNLAVNARDAMPSGGKLTIETDNRIFDESYAREHPGAKAGRYVRITVSDTGVGMTPEAYRHVFEPFFTTKEKGKGTGLGLSTVYGIVKQSGGYINCYSEQGKGTTFTIYLPLSAEEPEETPAASPRTPAPKGKETILLVEDDEAVRKFTREVLEREGYSVLEASDGEEALSEASSFNIEVTLLVTDVVMPHMSGKELAHKLEELFPRMKKLFISGYTANAIVHRDVLDSGLEFMQKPFSSREFLSKVRDILDRQ